MVPDPTSSAFLSFVSHSLGVTRVLPARDRRRWNARTAAPRRDGRWRTSKRRKWSIFFADRARFSLTHGGKDRHPFPVPTLVYDRPIEVLKAAV
jgi:hypothetical protein